MTQCAKIQKKYNLGKCFGVKRKVLKMLPLGCREPCTKYVISVGGTRPRGQKSQNGGDILCTLAVLGKA